MRGGFSCINVNVFVNNDVNNRGDVMDFMDKFGNPLELMEWARLFEDKEYSRVDHTLLLKNGLEVSTIWIGHNMNLFSTGVPQIFETAILKDGKFLEVYRRCDTLENAILMHNEAVERFTEDKPDDK